MDFVDDLERRDHRRVKRQLPCKLLVDGQTRQGVVRDVSAGGLFVHTRRPLANPEGLVVAIHTAEGSRFVLQASQQRRSLTPQSLADHTLAGAGLRLQDPPATYLRWVEEFGEASS